MSSSSGVSSNYLERLLEGQPLPPSSHVPRLDALRMEALDRVGVLTVPTTRDEEWRFTDLSALTRLSFQPVREATPLGRPEVEAFILDAVATRLVFVDGVHAPELSHIPSGDEAVVANLGSLPPAAAAAAEEHLGRHLAFTHKVFAALNTAFLHDAAMILIPPGANAAPVHVLHVATQPGAASYPRCLVVAGAGSTSTLIEDYVSLQDDAYFSNAATEVALADDACVHHIRVQREGARAFHVANCAVALGHHSRYKSVSVAFGARLSRYDLDVLQAGEGAECTIDGLALINGRQLADTHTSIDHAKPNGVSRQLHKCIAGGAAHAVFNGKILVRSGAQRTDSSQSSRNLLLSRQAHVDTKPQLEIFADDVKCAHGATIGQLDDEQLFYLRARGLSELAARNLLTYAFGAEVIERIPVAALRRSLERTVLDGTRNPS